ncbi:MULTISPECIES: hypothetical protein [Anaerolinea]|jgi:hypothetical protein|uniref:hypothetical protein n=1 Tax=Anaerolinea TaxID=233189 RepID=UPI002627154D|nr:hypothetical protein [Anaerolinea thermophila]
MDKTWEPAKLDLALSAGIALAFPFVAGFLYLRTGAFLPMLLYYGLAWGLVKWRRGSIGYLNPFPPKPPIAFYINLGVIALSLVCAWLSPIVNPSIQLPGMLLTALVWAPVNAATEQILWIYLFEAWDLYPKKTAILYRATGLLFFAAFVGMIHTFFWTRFLQTVDPGTIFGTLFVVLTSLSGFLHLVVWRQSRQMVFTFIPHFILNLLPIFWTYYSILPYLFRF